MRSLGYGAPLPAIPEDARSAGAAMPPRHPGATGASRAGSSTRGVRDDATTPSVVSDAPALLMADPTPEPPAADVAAARDDWRRRRTRRLRAAGLGALLAAVAVLAVVLVVRLGPGGGSGSSDSGDASVTAPVPTTNVSQAVVQYIDAVLRTVSAPADLADPSAPQYAARDWLLTRDLLLQDVLLAGAPRLAQRYVAALLAFALGPDAGAGGEATYLRPDAAECDWAGLACAAAARGHVLTEVRRSRWNLSGSLPAELYSLSALEVLDLSGNALFGALPGGGHIFKLQDLTSLDLSDNQLSGTVPGVLWVLPELRYLYLNGNRFSGTVRDALIPTEGKGSKLVDVWLYDNALSGPLPAALFQTAHHLRTWAAYGNLFSGPLPSEVASAALQFFDASGNRLNGTLDGLADGLLSSAALETLYLDHNQFGGSLPSDLGGRAPRLLDVWLHDNQLTGTVPSDFGAGWERLRELRLQQNRLSGTIADQCGAWPALERLEADCGAGTGGAAAIACDCCTKCV